jgi:Immunity protein Imm1
MAGIRAKVQDPSDDRILVFRRDLDSLLDAAAADARAQSLLNVVILIAANGNELSLVVGSPETALGFTVAGPPLRHFASVGAVQTIEPVLTAYLGLRHHTEFPRRHVIPSSHGRVAAAEFFDTGARPTSVSWEVV